MSENRISLKSIKVCEWASEETICFEASLYFDGVKIGRVGNDGHGGCNWERTDKGRETQWVNLLAYIKTLPSYKGVHRFKEGDVPYELDADLESEVGALLDEWQRTKDEKRIVKRLRGGTVKILPDGLPEQWNGAYLEYKKTVSLERARAICKHPKAVFIADLTDDQLLALVRSDVRFPA